MSASTRLTRIHRSGLPVGGSGPHKKGIRSSRPLHDCFLPAPSYRASLRLQERCRRRRRWRQFSSAALRRRRFGGRWRGGSACSSRSCSGSSAARPPRGRSSSPSWACATRSSRSPPRRNRHLRWPSCSSPPKPRLTPRLRRSGVSRYGPPCFGLLGARNDGDFGSLRSSISWDYQIIRNNEPRVTG